MDIEHLFNATNSTSNVQHASHHSTSYWPLGVGIYLLGTTSMALGANLQRWSIRQEEQKPEPMQRPKRNQPVWVAGFLMFSLSGIFLSLGLLFASQTVLAPLILFLFVSNPLFAHLVNGEDFNWRSDGLATLLVMVGVLLCVSSAPKDFKNPTTAEMIQYYHTPSFAAFCILVAFVITTLYVAKTKILRSVDGDFLRLQNKLYENALHLLQLSFGGLAGVLGGVNITLTKSTFSLMITRWEAGGMLSVVSSPLLWAISMTLVSTYVLQMYCVADGLAHSSAVIVIGTQAVTEEVTAVLGGLLYFQDYRSFSVKGWCLFSVGSVLSVVAVIVLSRFRMQSEMAAFQADRLNDGKENKREAQQWGQELTTTGHTPIPDSSLNSI